MSAAATKKALKSIRQKLADKEHEGALYEATQLLKTIGAKALEAPTVLAFRALALTNLERIDEAEKSYLHALSLAPGHPLATPGIKKLYIASNRWDDLGKHLEIAVQAAYDEGDAEKVSAALQELVEHRLEHGPEDKVYAALRLLLPSSPLVPLIQSAPMPAGGYVPLPNPTFPVAPGTPAPALPRPLPHVYHLAGSLALVLFVLLRTQAEIHTTTETKVKAGRMRIHAGTERDVRRNVEAEILGGPLGGQMVDLLRDVAAHPATDEDMRREAEVQEFKYWRRLVEVITPEKAKGRKPSGSKASKTAKPKTPEETEDVAAQEPELFQAPTYSRPSKAEALTRANGLAEGFILLGVGGAAKDAWSWVIEGKDEPTIFYDLDLLHKFAQTFPTSALTDFIYDYCILFKLALPKEESAAGQAEPAAAETKVKYQRPRRGKGGKGPNVRERRKAMREAARAAHLSEDVDEEEREQLIASMTALLAQLSKSIFAHRVMARVAIQEGDWENAIKHAERGRKLVKTLEDERGISLKNVQTSLDAALGVALVPYYPPKHHSRALRLLNGVLDVLPADYDARFAVGEIAETAGDWAGARADFQTLLDQGGDERQMVAAREELGWCLVNEGQLDDGREVLEQVVEMRDTRKEQLEQATAVGKEFKDDEAPARARAWWRLGQTEWMIGDAESRENAEQWFMASMRADASFAPAYTALGICYAEAHSPPDTERALRCFQKAFELDATEAEAARRLAYGYADDDEWAQVRSIAVRVMEGEGGVEGVAGGEVMSSAGRFAPKNGWAWKALGSTEMHYKNFAKAAQAYQIALRAEPEDAGMWRMLGDAYVKCGRHTAGLRALEKALELDPDMWMAQYHIGEVHMQLGAYAAAIEAFDAVDYATGGTEVGITAVLAEATLALGRQAAAGGFRERSRSAFHSAITYAARVLGRHAHRAWGWKLVADAALELAEHETEDADVAATAAVLHPVLELLVADDDDRRSTVTGLGHASNLLQAAPGPQYTATAAVFALAYRAHLLKNEVRVATSALYDLGAALYALSSAAVDTDVRTAATKAAVAAIRVALDADPSDERLWNALGVVCATAGPAVAQHAFVVSLECYAKDPVVWSNLGYLYLGVDDSELANACFLKSQTLDPDYAPAWFGQGVLASRDGERDAATSLFAHAVTLSGGALLEADLALALGAFERSLSPTASSAPLHQPAFALRRYTAAHPRDPAAGHLYALVCERLGLADAAADALERATSLLEDEFEATESPQVEANYTVALANLGRVRLAAAHYAPALEAYTNCAQLIADATEPRVTALLPQVQLGTALAHFWLGDLDASLDAFQQALDAAKNDDGLTDELVVLLARTLWGVGGEDAREAAKTHLLECLEHPEPSVKLVASLGAVGLASGDTDLVDAAVSELDSSPLRRWQDPQGLADIVLFAAALVAGDELRALAVLERAAAATASLPTAARARTRLARAYVAAGKTAEAAALLTDAKEADTADAAQADTARGLADVLEGSDGVAALERAVMLCPWDQGAWEALAWARRAEVEVGAEGA